MASSRGVGRGQTVLALHQRDLAIRDLRLGLDDLAFSHPARPDQRAVDLELLLRPVERFAADGDGPVLPDQAPVGLNHGLDGAGDRVAKGEDVHLLADAREAYRRGIDGGPEAPEQRLREAEGPHSAPIGPAADRLGPSQAEFAAGGYPHPRSDGQLHGARAPVVGARRRVDAGPRAIPLLGDLEREPVGLAPEPGPLERPVAGQCEVDRLFER